LESFIKKLQEQKVKVISDDIEMDIFDIHISSIKILEKSIADLKNDMQEFLSLSLDLKYHDLFRAISAFEKESKTDKTICPACNTPISKTVINPFVNASSELNKLKKLSELKEHIATKAIEVSKQTKSFKENDRITSIATKLGNDFKFSNITDVVYTNIESISTWLNILINEMAIVNEEYSMFQYETLKQQCIDYNKKLSEERIQRGRIDSELNKYNKYKDRLIELSTIENRLKQERQSLICTIEQFEKDNEEVLKKIKNEQESVDLNKKYIESYDKLIKWLKEYRNSLPVSLSAGLADKVKEYYNVINSHDSDFDKIENINLPANVGDKIEIQFIDSTEKIDILRILSEGHIKILGLSILLAKVVSEDLKFIIFDDIVNAIDDEHKDGVADLLLNHADMKGRQLILTCHGDIFINKLEHKLGALRASKEVIKYTFYPMDSSKTRTIRISKNNAYAGHYLLQAENSLSNNVIFLFQCVHQHQNLIYKVL